MQLKKYPPTTSDLVKNVVKKYNAMDYTHNLRVLLSEIVPNDQLEVLGRFDIQRMINDLVLREYEGEQVLKYKLFKAFAKTNVVAAYEIKVRNSRVDFLTVDDFSTSFEIKSALDNLDKLVKQAADYMCAFELNNILIDKRHLEKCIKLLPKSFGIIVIDRSTYSYIRKPILNRCLNTDVQLSLLTKKEIISSFGFEDYVQINSSFSASEINIRFKNALKKRYSAKWEFLVANSGEILPIDLQFFFNKNINPRYVYS